MSAAPATPSAAETPERLAFYDRISQKHLTPLWTSLAKLVTPEPVSGCQPASWSFPDSAAAGGAHSLDSGGGRLDGHGQPLHIDASAAAGVRVRIAGMLIFCTGGCAVGCQNPMLPDLPIRTAARTHAVTGFPPHRRKHCGVSVGDVLSDVVDAVFVSMNCRGNE